MTEQIKKILLLTGSRLLTWAADTVVKISPPKKDEDS